MGTNNLLTLIDCNKAIILNKYKKIFEDYGGNNENTTNL